MDFWCVKMAFFFRELMRMLEQVDIFLEPGIRESDKLKCVALHFNARSYVHLFLCFLYSFIVACLLWYYPLVFPLNYIWVFTLLFILINPSFLINNQVVLLLMRSIILWLKSLVLKVWPYSSLLAKGWFSLQQLIMGMCCGFEMAKD